jgi:hypothetical protein
VGVVSKNNLPISQEQAINRAKVKAFRWPKGQSGNPTGRSRVYYEARKLAHDAAPAMMRELIELAKTAEDERVKSVCLIAVLDRAGVKPIEASEMLEQMRSEKKFEFDIRDYSAAELDTIQTALEIIKRRRDEKAAAGGG